MGWYTINHGLVLKNPLPEAPSRKVEAKFPKPSNPGMYTFIKPRDGKSLAKSNPRKKLISEIIASSKVPRNKLEHWTIAATIVSVLGILSTLYMLVYFLMRMCDGTVQGNQAPGLLLLFAILCMYATAPLFVLSNSEVICTARHFAHGISYVLAVGVLLMKILQLRALVYLGLGGKVPVLNQIIPLIFVVMIQVILSAQWYVHHKPLSVESDSKIRCIIDRNAFMMLQIYVIFLLLFTFALGLTVRKVKRNYNEARWVTLATVLNVPVLIASYMVDFMGPSDYHEPAVAFALVISASIILFVVFVPKLNTISKKQRYHKHKNLSATNSLNTVFSGGSFPNPSHQSSSRDSAGSSFKKERPKHINENLLRTNFYDIYRAPRGYPR